MPTGLKNEAAIVGIGETKYTKNSGVSDLHLATEAVSKAIADCGVDPRDVDGIVTYEMDMSDGIEVARAVGLGDLTFESRMPYGGGACIGTILHATMALATGAAKYVVCYRALNGRSGHRYSMGVSGQMITSDTIHYGWYMPSGLVTPASWVAMFARRYMYETGTTSEALGEVAVQTRSHAVNNPAAFFYQRPLTMQEHQAARMIVDPLRLYDCCQETDGGAAVVLTTPERAKDLKQTPAVVRGIAHASADDQEQMTSFYRESVARMPEVELVAKQLWEKSGMRPDDIDCAILYDAFTVIVLQQLEAYGFCKFGEAKDFVKNGNISVGGRLPTNTHGGQLSEAYIHGMNGIVEGVRQVRGTSTNQPRKHDHTLVTSGLGVPTSAMILGRD
ncbi:MAG: lipid-transfer protein [Myxococcota bacterium]|nr:lipid-transfer protein [Myxococcales bacterium]